MCECLCSDIKEHVVLDLPGACVVVDGYLGCRECAQLVGIDVMVFSPEGREDFIDTPENLIEPLPYGGPKGGKMASFELFSIEDLAEAIDAYDYPTRDEYEKVGDWIKEIGVHLIHDAFNNCQKRRSNHDRRW